MEVCIMQQDRITQNQSLKAQLAEKGLFSHTSAPWQQKLIKEFFKDIPLQESWTCLDAGCGIGNNIATLIQYFSHIKAIDYSDKAIKFVKDRFKNNVIHFHQADLHHLPFTDQSFDFVICTEALEHCHSPAQVIRELYRILSVDGYAIISSQNHFNVSAVVKLISEKVLQLSSDNYNYRSPTIIITEI